MTLANVVARMERSEIRDSRDAGPGLRGACHRARIRATRWLHPGYSRSRRYQVICPSGGLLTGLSSLISDFPKNISVPNHPKSNLELSLSHPLQGRIAIVTDAGWDAVDAAAFCARRDRRAGWRKACERSTARGRGMLQRTAKSCGPDAPMLASSSRRLRRPNRA